MKKNLIVGVGNVLMGDEGVGVYFLQFIAPELKDFDILPAGSVTLSTLSELENRDCVIFIDALKEDFPEETALFEVLGENIPLKFSAHEIGISELVSLLQLLDRKPRKIFVFGIRPFSVSPRMGLSEEMEKRLPELKRKFLEMLSAVSF